MELYEPNKHLKLGIRIWPVMFRELLNSRELIWRLFIRNFVAKYRQTVLGYVWALIMPFVAIGTFVILNRSGILNIEKTDMPYPLFALIGLTVWQTFAIGLVSGTNSIVAAGSMIAKINFPRESLVFASMAQSIFELFIKMVLIVFCFFIFQFTPHWQVILFPLAILPIIILTLGLSLILSLVNGLLRDTANIISLLTTFLMFLTPVLYPIDDSKFLFKINPLSVLINAPRDLVTYGRITQPVYFIIATISSILIFLIAWRIFHVAETKIPERI